MTHQCNNCDKTFETRFNYNRHMERKIPCKPSQNKPQEDRPIIPTPQNNSQCKYCLKVFSCYTSLNRHVNKYCNIYKEQKQKQGDQQKDDNTTIKMLTEMQEKIKQLEAKYKELENNHITKINTQLIKFNSEKISEIITEEQCIILLQMGINSIPETLKYIHFNKNFPQYHNCYISSQHHGTGLYYDGDAWMSGAIDEIINFLITKIGNYLEGQFNLLQTKLSDDVKTHFNEYFDAEKDNHKTLKKKYAKDMKFILYNNRNMVIDKRKKDGTNKRKVLKN